MSDAGKRPSPTPGADAYTSGCRWANCSAAPAPPPPTPPGPSGQACNTGSVCAAAYSKNGEGCCPYENAVCCPNKQTCCPSGTTCEDSGTYNTVCKGAPVNQTVGLSVCKPGAALPLSSTLPNVLIVGDSVSIGYTPMVAKAMSKVQGTFTAGGNAFAQQGALAAITGPRDDVEAMRASYHHRRDLVVSLLGDIPGIKTVSPPATFYVLPDISGLLGKSAGNIRIETDVEFCNWLLEEFHLATVPGSAFAAPGCIRLSFAASDDDLRKGIARLAKAATALG